MNDNRPIEEWKDVPGYGGDYQVSNFYHVKSFKHGKERVMRTQMDESGELWISLSKEGKSTRFNVRVLMQQLFRRDDKS